MQVTGISVKFYRKIKPADYEGMDTEVGFTGILAEGEDHNAAAERLIDDAAVAALRPMGRDAAYLAARKKGATVQQAVDGAVKGTAVEATQTEKPKGKAAKGRSAPPEGQPVTAGGVAASDIPGSEPAPQIRTNGENRVNPDDAKAATGNSDIPGGSAKSPSADTQAKPTNGDIPAASAPATPAAKPPGDAGGLKDLQQYAAGVVQKGLSPDEIKKVLSGFGVQRMSDLKPTDYAAVRAKIEAIAPK